MTMKAQTQRLLDVRTVPGCMEKMSHVRVLSDGVLLNQAANDHAHVFAMSLAGPEEALRCVQAGCVMVNKEGQRGCKLDIVGGGYTLRNAVWGGVWDSKAVRLKDGPMHLLAWCTSFQPQKGQRYPVVYPASNDETDIATAIYTTLLNHHTTPLIPTGVPGQPEEEALVGEEWRSIVCAEIMHNRNWWQPLMPHPGQQGLDLPCDWWGAGLLRIEQVELDSLVSRLVRARHLKIPAAGPRSTARKQLAAVAG